MTILNIKEWTAAKKLELKEKIQKAKKIPSLAIIQMGNNEASNRYVRNKCKDCNEIGVQCEVIRLAQSITLNEFLKQLDYVIECGKYSHLIIQKPLPPQLEDGWSRIVEAIPFDMDIDGFTVDSKYESCTPYGIMAYLKACGIKLDGANVVIIGRSDLVGKPLAKMMLAANATVTICHSHTKYIQDFTRRADVVVVAVGKAGVLDATWAPNAQIIVDVGINFDANGKLIGDVTNYANDKKVTPVPGGVGLLTRWALLDQMCQEV